MLAAAGAPPPPPPSGNYTFGHGPPASAVNVDPEEEVGHPLPSQIDNGYRQLKLSDIFQRAACKSPTARNRPAFLCTPKRKWRKSFDNSANQKQNDTVNTAVGELLGIKPSVSDSTVNDSANLEILLSLQDSNSNSSSPKQKRARTDLDQNSQEYFESSLVENLKALFDKKQTVSLDLGRSNTTASNNVYFLPQHEVFDKNNDYHYEMNSENYVTNHMYDDYTFQNDSEGLPSVAKVIWRQSRGASVDAEKIDEREVWYGEAITRNLMEPWTLGLDKIPPYLAHQRDFMAKIVSERKRSAMNIMNLTRQFLKDEAIRLQTLAASHLTTVERLVNSEYQGDDSKAHEVMDQAVQVIKATKNRERAKERKSLEERGRNLSLRRPNDLEIADPSGANFRSRGSDQDNHPFRGHGNRVPMRSRGRRPGRRGPPQ